ncbi:MAG: hypothetical protein ACI9WU_004991 [Myxococcota bacterium]|jgi:hypothetical protein
MSRLRDPRGSWRRPGPPMGPWSIWSDRQSEMIFTWDTLTSTGGEFVSLGANALVAGV